MGDPMTPHIRMTPVDFAFHRPRPLVCRRAHFANCVLDLLDHCRPRMHAATESTI
jgi:hypothetical protein